MDVQNLPQRETWLCLRKAGQWGTGSQLVKEYLDKEKEILVKRLQEKEVIQPAPTKRPQLYASLYKEIQKQIEIPELGGNLFVDLATRIAHTLDVKDCWVCGGPLMSSRWPWRGSTVEVWDLFEWNITEGRDRGPQEWLLTNTPVVTECIARPRTLGKEEVGISPCQRILTLWENQTRTWWPEEPKWYLAVEDWGNCTIIAPVRDKTDNESWIWNCTGNNPYQGLPLTGPLGK